MYIAKHKAEMLQMHIYIRTTENTSAVQQPTCRPMMMFWTVMGFVTKRVVSSSSQPIAEKVSYNMPHQQWL